MPIWHPPNTTNTLGSGVPLFQSLLSPGITYASPGNPFYGPANVNPNPTFDTLTVVGTADVGGLLSVVGGIATSALTATGQINTSSLTATGQINTSNLTVTASTITNSLKVNTALNLDGSILTTQTSGPISELLLNGIPIATTSNITNVADWALYSAAQDVNVSNHHITDFVSLNFAGSNVLLTASNTSLLINGNPVQTGTPSTINSLSGATCSVTADPGAVPQVGLVTITGQNGTYGKLDLVANSGIGGVSGGNISLTANGGFGTSGLFGQVDIVANQGVASGITTGGKINITANSGLSGGLTSAVNVNAGGITVQSGYSSPVGSVAGYTFVGGNSGVNICGGLPGTIPNVPGTTYIYGTTGIELGATTFLTNVRPYQFGLVNASDITIAGRSENIGLGNHTAYVNLSTCKTISFGGTGDPDLGQITGLSTINGAAYVAGGGVSDRITSAGGSVIVGPVGQINITPASGQPTIINAGITITDNNITEVNSLQFNTSGPPSGQIVNLSTINGVAYAPAITNRASSTTPISITATTSGTAQQIANLSMLTTIAGYDLDIFACIVFTTDTNTIVNINCFVTIDSVPVGQTFSSSIGGIGHFLTFPVQCSLLGATASTHSVAVECYASTGTNITMNSYQLTGIGNLA